VLVTEGMEPNYMPKIQEISPSNVRFPQNTNYKLLVKGIGDYNDIAEINNLTEGFNLINFDISQFFKDKMIVITFGGQEEAINVKNKLEGKY
jgi:hypothetical protein